MDVNDAYDIAMDAITDLEQMDIKVKRIPSRSQNDPTTVTKYGDQDRLPPNKWLHIQMYWDTEEQRLAIHQKAKELSWQGICFDIGGSFGFRDWELDWSFCVKNTADGEREFRMDSVEDVIVNEIENGEGDL